MDMVKKIFILLFVATSLKACFSDHIDLVDKFRLLEGDGDNDRYLVYCTGYDDDKSCISGLYVVPTVGQQYQTYVKRIESDKDWIVVQSIQRHTKEEGYWIVNKFDLTGKNCDAIDCDSLIRSHVVGPLDSLQFNERVKQLGIKLKF